MPKVYKWVPNDLMARAGVGEMFVVEPEDSPGKMLCYEHEGEWQSRAFMERTGTLVEMREVKDRKKGK